MDFNSMSKTELRNFIVKGSETLHTKLANMMSLTDAEQDLLEDIYVAEKVLAEKDEQAK